LLDWTADHSQQAESTRKGGDSAHRHWRKKWNATFCNFKHSVQLNIELVCNMMYQNCTLYLC